MELETWIDGASPPIPDSLPAEFQNREVIPVGFMGIANSSRRGGISAKMNGKRVFGTLYHPYIVGGRFAWCNGVWFVLDVLKIPAVVLLLNREAVVYESIFFPPPYAHTHIPIASAYYQDDSIESHFAFLNTPYFCWVNQATLDNEVMKNDVWLYPPRIVSSSVPAPYYETRLGIGAPTKKIATSTLGLLKITPLNQLDFIEIFPMRYCWSVMPPYFKDNRQNWQYYERDYFGMSENLSGFNIQQSPIDSQMVTHTYVENQTYFSPFLIQETFSNYKPLIYPTLPDPNWAGIKATRTRTIDGYQFIEYAFEVKAQPCDIEITIDPSLSSTRTDTFCLEYEDYNQLLNRFDNIEQRLNELPN